MRPPVTRKEVNVAPQGILGLSSEVTRHHCAKTDISSIILAPLPLLKGLFLKGTFLAYNKSIVYTSLFYRMPVIPWNIWGFKEPSSWHEILSTLTLKVKFLFLIFMGLWLTCCSLSQISHSHQGHVTTRPTMPPSPPVPFASW